MANGAVCSRMCTQLVMTFRHPYSQSPISKARGHKIGSCQAQLSEKPYLNMAQWVIFEKMPHLSSVPDKLAFVKVFRCANSIFSQKEAFRTPGISPL